MFVNLRGFCADGTPQCAFKNGAGGIVAVVILVILMVLVLFLIAGFAYNYRVRNIRGMAAIPGFVLLQRLGVKARSRAGYVGITEEPEELQ